MGSTKVENQTQSQQTSTPTQTPEEQELNKMQLEQQRAIQPYAIPLQQQAYTLGQLLLGGQQLPGYLQPLPGGATAGQLPFQPDIPVSAGTLGEDYTADIVRQSLRDIYPQFQAMGLPIESGVAQSIAGRTAGDIRRNVAQENIANALAIEEYNRAQRQATGEFNVNTQMTTQYQNLNTLLNLLNLAVGGQAQIQQPVLATGSTLGQRLAGLRSVSQTETGTQTQSQNPFLQSLYSGLGSVPGNILSRMGQGTGMYGGGSI